VRTAAAEMTSYDTLDRAHRDRVTRLCRVLLADVVPQRVPEVAVDNETPLFAGDVLVPSS